MYLLGYVKIVNLWYMDIVLLFSVVILCSLDVEMDLLGFAKNPKNSLTSGNVHKNDHRKIIS